MITKTLVIVTTLIVLSSAHSQIKRTIITSKGDSSTATLRTMEDNNILNVPELSAIITENGEHLVVDNVMDAQMRMKGYEKTDVQEGDIILMANGKKMQKLDELKKEYGAALIGSTVKFGIKRHDEMMIASFVKADPKSLPKVRMMISHGDDDILALPQAGLIVGSKGKNITVRGMLPNAAKDFPDIHVAEGDVVESLNGTGMKSFKEFREGYEKIAVGEKVSLSIVHEGKTQTLSFSKKKDEGKMIIRRQGK